MDFELNDEQQAFKDATRRWVEKEIPKSWARELERQEHDYPFALWDKFTAAGFHGIGIDEKYGGQGGDVVIQMLLARELARPLGGLAMVWGITSFAGAKCFSLFGTEQQKQRLLPQISAGKLRAAVSITEPGGGTDVLGALRTSAVRVAGGWEITGSKIWSSSSQVADYLLVLARTDPTPAKRHQGLTLFFVPAKQSGISITPLGKLGMRALGSCVVTYDHAFVPDDLVLGEPGRGWQQMIPTINNERIMVGAFCLGVLDGILEDAIAYAKDRVAFGRPIGQYQSIQHYIADIATWRQQIELLLLYTAWLESTGRPCDLQTNMLKVSAATYANQAADLGIQILGGMGYSADTDMQRYWRDSRLWRIGPVTDEMTRNGIAEQLGLPRSY